MGDLIQIEDISKNAEELPSIEDNIQEIIHLVSVSIEQVNGISKDEFNDLERKSIKTMLIQNLAEINVRTALLSNLVQVNGIETDFSDVVNINFGYFLEGEDTSAPFLYERVKEKFSQLKESFEFVLQEYLEEVTDYEFDESDLNLQL